jgi:hypothetical protein
MCSLTRGVICILHQASRTSNCLKVGVECSCVDVLSGGTAMPRRRLAAWRCRRLQCSTQGHHLWPANRGLGLGRLESFPCATTNRRSDSPRVDDLPLAGWGLLRATGAPRNPTTARRSDQETSPLPARMISALGIVSRAPTDHRPTARHRRRRAIVQTQLVEIQPLTLRSKVSSPTPILSTGCKQHIHSLFNPSRALPDPTALTRPFRACPTTTV